MKTKETFTRSATMMAIMVMWSGVQAEPVTYRFETAASDAPTVFGDYFLGRMVTGSFDYDAETPSGGDLPGGATLYPAAMTDLNANVGGIVVSDPVGLAIVGDDRQFGAAAGDGVIFSSDPALASGAPPEFFNIEGFDVDGYRLVNFRFFWLESITGEDFLADQLLPDPLPGFVGRLALDFVAIDNPADIRFVFFEDFTVTRSVGIDVKPGGEDNCVNVNGHGVIPVAILGDSSLDVMDIDQASLRFGGLEVRVRGNRGPMCHVHYANGDSYLDLMCQFEDDSSNWNVGNGEVVVSGSTHSGRPFTGSTELCVVP